MTEMIAELGLSELSVHQRIQLISELWDSLPATEPGSQLSPAQQQDLVARLESEAISPQPGTPWPEVYARLQRNARQ